MVFTPYDAGYAALVVPSWRFALQGVKLFLKYAEMRKVKLSTHAHAYFKTDSSLERTREKETDYYTPPSFSHVARIQLSHTHSYTHVHMKIYNFVFLYIVELLFNTVI